MNYNHYRSPFGPRFHFDEAGAGGAAGAGAGGAAGAGAGGATPWFDGIDAETLGHWDNKGWKYKENPKDLAVELTKAWKGLEKNFGVPAEQLLKLPKDTADEAGWSAVHQRLGMPKEPKDYDLSGVKYADGSDLEAGFVDTMRAALHKAHASKDAAPEVVKAVVKYLGDADAAEASERATRTAAEKSALQQEWGKNFDFNHLTAMQGAKRVVGSDDAAKSVVSAMEQAIGYKATMEFWRKIGAGTTEDTFVEVGSGGNPTTRNGAVARKAELEGDPAWVARYLKGDVKAKQEMDNLLAQISGQAA